MDVSISGSSGKESRLYLDSATSRPCTVGVSANDPSETALTRIRYSHVTLPSIGCDSGLSTACVELDNVPTSSRVPNMILVVFEFTFHLISEFSCSRSAIRAERVLYRRESRQRSSLPAR